MFLCVCTFTREEKNFYNKNCLFYANFFKFEVFCSGIKPQHTAGVCFWSIILFRYYHWPLNLGMNKALLISNCPNVKPEIPEKVELSFERNKKWNRCPLVNSFFLFVKLTNFSCMILNPHFLFFNLTSNYSNLLYGNKLKKHSATENYSDLSLFE